MIRNRDFIVFSDDWGRLPFSCQHIMQHFLPENRILWVNTVGLRRPVLNFCDIKRSFEKIRSFFMVKGEIQDSPRNLWISDPMMIPYSQLRIVREFNKFSAVKKIRAFIKRYGFSNPVVISTVPNVADYVKEFNEDMVIYYCIDDYTRSPALDSSLVEKMEEKLLYSCDLVVASSRDLCEKKKRGMKQPLFLPHGVDFDHFQVGKGEVHEMMRHLPRPTIGFFGVISHWLNVQLIKFLANERPRWSFVFIGPSDIDLRVFGELKNTHFPGKVSYEELPNYAAEFDVGIIPFLLNDFTVSVNPIKLLEYLACGLPVVTIDMPEVRTYSGVVHIASSFEDFLLGLEKSLRENNSRSEAERKKIARKYSWISIAEKLSAIIAENSGKFG
ncbi:MAG: glycosyltransferase [Deltaproteobacteria bacterium]|nr:glycosyltransferase [Deltaproteobacteria bacterium]